MVTLVAKAGNEGFRLHIISGTISGLIVALQSLDNCDEEAAAEVVHHAVNTLLRNIRAEKEGGKQ